MKEISLIYRFCAQSVHYPQENWFTSDYLHGLYSLLTGLQATRRRQALRTTLENDPHRLDTLQIEYTRLFINAIPHVVAPPYGSVYIDKSLQSRFTEQMLAYYHSRGFDPGEKADLPDHLIHQLEFLSYLADTNDVAGEKEFLDRFFAPWFSHFAIRIKKDNCHLFYRCLIDIIEYFTMEEEQYDVPNIEA